MGDQHSMYPSGHPPMLLTDCYCNCNCMVLEKRTSSLSLSLSLCLIAMRVWPRLHGYKLVHTTRCSSSCLSSLHVRRGLRLFILGRTANVVTSEMPSNVSMSNYRSLQAAAGADFVESDGDELNWTELTYFSSVQFIVALYPPLEFTAGGRPLTSLSSLHFPDSFSFPPRPFPSPYFLSFFFFILAPFLSTFFIPDADRQKLVHFSLVLQIFGINRRWNACEGDATPLDAIGREGDCAMELVSPMTEGSSTAACSVDTKSQID